MTTNEFKIRPIGYVRAKEGSFVLEINKEYIAALKELDGFTHINVLFWCHHVDTDKYRKMTTSIAPYKKAPEKMGIFATRSPVRPNPIATTPVNVLNIDHDKGIIQIPYLDAEDGSPILDIKPYHPCIDRVRDADVPQWCSHWPKYYEESANFDWDAEFENAN